MGPTGGAVTEFPRVSGPGRTDAEQEGDFMSKDILSLISSKMNTFSKGQKLIANYILSSYDKAAFMTASKLGKTVHVS